LLPHDETAPVTVPIDVDPVAREAPHHLAVDSGAGALFVALAFPPPPKTAPADPHKSHGNAAHPGKIARLDLATLAVRETRNVDENPGDIVLTHDHAHLLVTHYDMRRAMITASRGGAPSAMFATLQVWDAKALTMVGERALCVAPHGVVTTADDKTAIVACYGSDELALVDISTPALTSARYPLGSAPGVLGVPRYGPYSATLTPDGALVAVADLEGADVRIFDLAKRAFLLEKTLSLGARVFMPVFVGARTLLAPLQAPDGLARVDVETGAVEERVSFASDTCKCPHVARVDKSGRVYVVCEGDHAGPGRVIEVDPGTLAVLRSWTVGVYPDGIAFGDD
jgi:DNA-binding beta-propeller fold protein YncE